MKIDLQSIDRENFLIQERFLKSGERVWLINPNHVGAKYTKDTLKFRSSVWNDKGEPVSFSFKKFFNWLEQPGLTSFIPHSIDDAQGGTQILEKLDGSTLIVSKYKGELITRTRGTINAELLDNGHEINVLKAKYPLAFDNAYLNQENVSFLFEWVSPINRIVIDYGLEPDIYLIGVISHDDYSLVYQSELDVLAEEIGVKRPKYFQFNTIPEMISAVEALKGQEGVCVYYNYGQDIRKAKALEYLAIHKFKEKATLENVVDLFCEYNYPSYSDFEGKLVKQFDFECWKLIQSLASRVCDAYKEVLVIKSAMQDFANSVRQLSRKDAAIKILSSYGQTNRASFVFQLLDGKELGRESIKKLLYQVLKT